MMLMLLLLFLMLLLVFSPTKHFCKSKVAHNLFAFYFDQVNGWEPQKKKTKSIGETPPIWQLILTLVRLIVHFSV